MSDTDHIEQRTRAAVQRLYDAYFAGDAARMVETMSDDVWVRFLGRVDFHGKEKARGFLSGNNPLLVDLQFDIKKLIIDGRHAAAIWEEHATTIHGRPYRNHGVDVFTVENDRITALHENNDVRTHREHFGS